MRFVDRYPIIVTPRLHDCAAFWATHLGFETVFSSSWFVLLFGPEGSASLAFMSPDHPCAARSGGFFGQGHGLNCRSRTRRRRTRRWRARLPITLPLTDEAFGQRRFGFHDPSGLWVDVVEQIEPAAGFWDRYMMAG